MIMYSVMKVSRLSWISTFSFLTYTVLCISTEWIAKITCFVSEQFPGERLLLHPTIVSCSRNLSYIYYFKHHASIFHSLYMWFSMFIFTTFIPMFAKWSDIVSLDFWQREEVAELDEGLKESSQLNRGWKEG